MSRSSTIIATLCVLFLIAAGSSGYFFWKYTSSADVAQNKNQNEVALVVARVARLAVLPDGETPTVATVANVELLRGQEFFKNAKNGDKVLVYTQAREAILYDPTLDKIVTIAALNPQDTVVTASDTSVQDVATSSHTP